MASSRPTHVQTLLAQVRSGNLEAFNQLFDRYRRLMRFVIRTQLGPKLRQKVDSDDLLQETYITASQSIHEFQGKAPESFVRWLQVIAARRVCDAYRRYIRSQKRSALREISLDEVLNRSSRSTDRLAVQLAIPTISPSKRLRRGEQLMALASAMAELPEHYQEIIQLRFIEEASLDRIATKLGRSKGAVAMLLTRAIDRLRKVMKQNAPYLESS